MIERVELKNFKRFSRIRLPIAPLTALVGTNGAGKSTLIQALLLARLAAETSGEDPGVQLIGPSGLDLGETSDVLNWGATETSLAVALVVTRGRKATWTFSTGGDRSQNLRLTDYTGPDPNRLGITGTKFVYLCAERLGPRDIGECSSDPAETMDVGPRGEHAAHILALLESREVTEPLRHPSSESGAVAHTLRTQVELWLSEIVRPIEVRAEWVANGSGVLLRFKAPGVREDWMRPANAGFGLSYALPIIVTALVLPEGGTLVVENPEAHLHPAGQARFGEFFARLALTGRQVIFETHSDHVIDGARRHLLEFGANLPRSAVMHFFSSSGVPDSVETEEIRLTDAADLTSRPRGFMDQRLADQRLLQALRRARK